MILVKNNQKLIGSPGCIQGNLFFLVDLTIHFLLYIVGKKREAGDHSKKGTGGRKGGTGGGRCSPPCTPHHLFV